MDLQAYMEEGVRSLVKRVGLYYLKNAAGRRFLAEFVPALQKSAAIREAAAKRGALAPQFLICSIAAGCNLHCAGCYARSGGICTDAAAQELSAAQWDDVFTQAAALGVSFILLAGGEPLLRKDVLRVAARHGELAFPVFTNATLLDEDYLELFAAHRNLVPVLSIEGDAAATDARRGAGVAAQVAQAAQSLQARGILYAASVTVTRENLASVATGAYLDDLRARGCGVAFFVEYVPAQPGTEQLVLTEQEAELLSRRVEALRAQRPDMCLFAFPGDEKYTDGCLAAGRGFFHINPSGGAEPCPFSSFSTLNVKQHPLAEVLASEYFAKVRAVAQADGKHDGGCTLFRHAAEVRALCGEN